MLGLAIIDMQNWMFRPLERMAQIHSPVANINAVSSAFAGQGLPVFPVETVHKADRSTWTRLMRRYDYACLIEGTEGCAFIRKSDCAPFLRNRRSSYAPNIASWASASICGAAPAVRFERRFPIPSAMPGFSEAPQS